MRISGPRPERTNEAVVDETPAALATSASVTLRELKETCPFVATAFAP
jgi:hypothetical protein